MHIKSVGGDDIHRLIKESFSVSGNRRMRKTHTLIASARRNHVVDSNSLVGIVNQRHREVCIRSVANSAVVAPRQCDLTLVIQQLNVQRQLETTLRHHHLRVINAKIRRNIIGFRNAITKANFPRCANCFGLRASFTLGAIHLFLATCYPCPFVASVGNIFPPTDFIDLHGFVFLVASSALGIGAASFWSVAEKDIAESPTASPERPKIIHNL